MSTAGYGNPFSISFILMKIRYVDYDKSIDGLKFVNRDDKVNVFINFESVLKNLSLIKDIENKLLLERDFTTILESEAINLCAHYKKFFRNNGLATRVFLYYTDLSSEEFDNFKYNDEYRSYYINKYLNNPKYQLLGNKLVDTVLPRVQKIMEFIPDVHFISCKGFDSSLVPMIIGESDTSYKNFIITNDKYDTQYLLHPDKYCTHYIKRSPMGTHIYCTFDKYITSVFKDDNEDNNIFNNTSMYSTLLSALGDKHRSIEPLKGIGCKGVLKYINNGINDSIITKDTKSFEMIKKCLPEEYHENADKNFNCVDLHSQFKEISQDHIFSVINQITNRFDYNSLIQLNNEDYKNFPLMLEELTC